jgi:DNA processing protein
MSVVCSLKEAMTLISWHRSQFLIQPEIFTQVQQALLEGITPWGDEILIEDVNPLCSYQAFERKAEFSNRFKLLEPAVNNFPFDWVTALQELREFQDEGFKICLYDELQFPNKLRQLRHPPWAISYLGCLAILDQRALSVVGAREISTVAQVWIETELQDFLSKTQVITVSGGARGVDQAVHWQSLKLNLPTVMVLPSGLKKVYPQNMVRWLEPIAKSGGVILSEFPPYSEMRKWHFFVRNRLIAALGDRVLIAQAQKKSGTWSTAQWALEEGRELLALASFPGITAFSGNIELIKIGVPPIFDHQDLIHHIYVEPEFNYRTRRNLITTSENSDNPL